MLILFDETCLRHFFKINWVWYLWYRTWFIGTPSIQYLIWQSGDRFVPCWLRFPRLQCAGVQKIITLTGTLSCTVGCRSGGQQRKTRGEQNFIKIQLLVIWCKISLHILGILVSKIIAHYITQVGRRKHVRKATIWVVKFQYRSPDSLHWV